MRALVFNKTLEFVDRLVMVKPGEALVRVTHAGICNTDLEIVKGYMGFSGVLGHEFVGIVEKSPSPEQIGLRVVGEINVGCGNCALCHSEDPRHCATRTVLGIFGRDGAFADYLTLPPKNLFPVPDNVPDLHAVFTEPIAAACEIVEQIKVQGKSTLIIGDGKLAQLIARVLPVFGAKCTVLCKHEKNAALLPPGTNHILLRDYKPRREFDLTIEASGKPEGFAIAQACLVPRGTLVLKSTYARELTHNPASLVIDEITVVGSRCGRFPPALALLKQGMIDPMPLISDRFSFDNALDAFERAKQPDAMKVILEFN